MTAEGPAVQAIRALIAQGSIHPSVEGRMLATAVLEDARAARRRSGGQVAAASPARDGSSVAAAGELDDATADLLFPPRSPEAAEARYQAAERRVARLAALPDAELHASLFGSSSFAASVGDVQDGEPGDGQGGEEDGTTHAAYEGMHAHEHASYDGSGGTHSHAHSHEGDASHNPGSGEHVNLPSDSHPELGDGQPG